MNVASNKGNLVLPLSNISNKGEDGLLPTQTSLTDSDLTLQLREIRAQLNKNGGVLLKANNDLLEKLEASFQTIADRGVSLSQELQLEFKSAIECIDSRQIKGFLQNLAVERRDVLEKINDISHHYPNAFASLTDVTSVILRGGNDALDDLCRSAGAVGAALDHTVAEVGNVFSSQEIKDVVSNSSQAINELLDESFRRAEKLGSTTASREAILRSMKELAGSQPTGCPFSPTSCPLLRLEIVRDVQQTIHLFFTNLYEETIAAMNANVDAGRILRKTKEITSAISSFVAIDVASSFQGEKAIRTGITLLFACVVVVYLSYLWFLYSAKNTHDRSNEIREGHETKTWGELSKERSKTVKLTTYALTLLLTVYLPLAKAAVEIIAKKPDNFIVARFNTLSVGPNGVALVQEKPGFVYVQLASYFVLATFILPLPFLLASIVHKNKPTGSTEEPNIVYDEDGVKVALDDHRYHLMVMEDKCPYKSLYAGFERKWCNYKVYQLVLKLTLLLIIIFLPKNERGTPQSAISLVVYGAMACLSFVATPFVDPLDDFLDAVGRQTALTTCFGGFLLSLKMNDGSRKVMVEVVGIIVFLCNSLNYVVMAGVFLYGNNTFRLALKNKLGRFTFSDTVVDRENLSATKAIAGWNLKRECKHRIWHAFWDEIIFLRCDDQNVGLRLLELKDATSQSGIENIRQHWIGESDPKISRMRWDTRMLLEGVDVYWDDATGTRDGVLDSKTNFGKFYVHPYPFHGVLVYDDASDETFIRHDNFEAFFDLNMSDAIQRKRAVRQKLRALDRWGGPIRHEFSRMETETVRDGTKLEHYTDENGTQKTREVSNYSTVRFECKYTNGIIRLKANSNKKMAAGFNVTMYYNDGCGEAVLPNTGEVTHFHSRSAEMGHDHIGLYTSMNETEILKKLFTEGKQAIELHLPLLLKEHADYRTGLVDKAQEKNAVLSNGFWYHVYNDENVTRANLECYFAEHEINDKLRAIPVDYDAELNLVYGKSRLVSNSRPAMRLWYVFWDDFFHQNSAMMIVQKHSDDFDPTKRNAICYDFKTRDELEEWLDSREMMARRRKDSPSTLSRLCSKQLFDKDILDALYQRIHELENPDQVQVKTSKSRNGKRLCGIF